MTGGADRGSEVVLETDRLLLRPWRVTDAVVHHQLWTERHPRVPPHRRIDADGRPTVADREESIRNTRSSSIDLLVVERKAGEDVIGYCGLVESGRGAEGRPELAQGGGRGPRDHPVHHDPALTDPPRGIEC